MENKRCNNCGEVKPISEFRKRKSCKDSYRGRCRSYKAEYGREYYKNNPEKERERNRRYRENNREKVREYQKKWAKNNPEKVREKARKYRKNNPEKVREYRKNNREKIREYYKNNREKIREHQKKWNEINKERIKKRAKKYHKKYYKENHDRLLKKFAKYREKNKEILVIRGKEWRKNNKDKIKKKYKNDYIKNKNSTIYKINTSISRMIRRDLKRRKNGNHWEYLVNYTLKDLMIHLESQFKPGMTWQNIGKWHIDHRIPVSLWEFSSYEDREFKQCWALCNLQPLWAKENMSKGNKI